MLVACCKGPLSVSEVETDSEKFFGVSWKAEGVMLAVCAHEVEGMRFLWLSLPSQTLQCMCRFGNGSLIK